MTIDIFAAQNYGKIALKKIGPVPKNFRLYRAGWLSHDRSCMEIVGAEFREAKSGPLKGRLSILIPGTDQNAFVTAEEMESFNT